MTNYPNSRKTNIVVQDLENEVLIYDLSINKAYCLNQTSALVYQLCDGTKTVSEISDLMRKKLKTLVSEDLVWFAINELKNENLLEEGDKLANNFTGLSRRDVIRKIGLGSMVALPLISSIVAPKAIHAASGCFTTGTLLTDSCANSDLSCNNSSFNGIRSGSLCCSGTAITVAQPCPSSPANNFACQCT